MSSSRIRLQGVGHTVALRSARAANAVDIVFILVGHIIVKYRIHIVHINAPGSHIRGHKHMELALPEPGHHRLPFALRNVPVDALGVQSTHLQEFSQALRGSLGIAEAHDPLQLLSVNDAGNGVHLLVRRNLQTVLQDIGLILLGGLYGDLLRVTLVHPGDVHDLPGNGGRKHPQILALGDLVQNPGNIVNKTHVQHPVRLIQHHRLHFTVTVRRFIWSDRRPGVATTI